MKLKMSQLLNIKSIFDTIKEKKLPIRTAYKINKLFSPIDNEFSFYQQKFGEIVLEYGKKDENGNFIYAADGASIEIMDGRQVECQAKVEELNSIEIDLPDIKFTLDELDGLNFTLGQLECLMPFIEE